MLSVTILNLTIRLSATCSVFPILDEWTVDNVTVTLGNDLGFFFKILTWSKNIKAQQFEVSGSTRTFYAYCTCWFIKKKILFDSKWKQNEKCQERVNVSLQLCYLGPFSSHLCSNSTSPPLKEKKKRHPQQGERKGSTLALCFFSSGGDIALHSLMCFERVDHKIEAETFTVGWHINNTPGRLKGGPTDQETFKAADIQ